MQVSCRQQSSKKKGLLSRSPFTLPGQIQGEGRVGEVRVIKWVQLLLPRSVKHTTATQRAGSLSIKTSFLAPWNSWRLGDTS